MNNMEIYNAVREVPKDAKRPIKGGRLKGMTDINPMWRVKKLTEIFGPCGIGWWFDVTREELVPNPTTGQVACFVDILLYYRWNGEVSHGIPGTGGSMFVNKESGGLFVSDECYKMAQTDAISVAAKALGIGADVYWDKDTTKYSNDGQAGQADPKSADKPKDTAHAKSAQKPTQPPTEQAKHICADCGAEITGYKIGNTEFTLADHLRACKRTFGVAVCRECADRRLNAPENS